MPTRLISVTTMIYLSGEFTIADGAEAAIGGVGGDSGITIIRIEAGESFFGQNDAQWSCQLAQF